MNFQDFDSSTPLVIALADEPQRREYAAAVDLARLAEASYDPVSQTAIVPIFAGTNGTVCSKVTGMGIRATTDYPTDDD